MSDYSTTGDLNEIIYYEKLDADMEMANLEAEGRRHYTIQLRVQRLLKAGDFAQATLLCDHGHIGGLTGSCSVDDPRYMQSGYRCYECGGHVTDMNGTVIHTR